MTPDRWRRIELVFEQSVDLPEPEREKFVTDSCGDDPTLRDEVLGLLAAEGGERLHVVVGAAASELVRDADNARIGQRVGPYRIVELIGRGGMGTVYRAERDDGEFERTVAIKVLELGTGTQALARFRDERQILARLAHPHIVRLLDGGTTDDGTPYLAMEHVAGVPITTFARELPVAACVELVIAVCDALAYAHGLGVIHRDIKPSNIIVGERGPQLLDFGIAKLVDPDAGREAETRTGAALLTPEYASPEQARGDPVTGATDIYSVGAVLYELLAHRRPLVLAGNMLEILRAISEDEPPRPSAVAPAGRGISPDLDRVVLGALGKHPGKRYASAAAFAGDLRAYLGGEHISPPNPQARRWPWLLAGACAVAATAAAVIALRPHAWLPAGDHALAVHVTGDDQLAPATARMVAKALRTRERRFVTVDNAGGADLIAELAVRRDGDGVVISGALVADGRLTLPDVRASSVETALATLVPAIGDAVGGDDPPRDPDASERAAMERVGATSLDEYDTYQAIGDAQLGTIKSDTDAIRRDLESLVARDPGWAHPWGLLVLLNGFTTHEQTDLPTLARAKLAVGAGARDPSGRAVLEAIDLMQHNDTAGAAHRLEPAAAADPDDMLVALELHNAYSYGGRPDESIALLRRVHELRADLEWGADLAGELRASGRGAEVEPLVRAWIERAPESEQAGVSLIVLELAAHHTDAALQRARDLLILRDEAPHRLLLLCDVLITAGRTQDAAPVAEKLLHGSISVRASGLQRMGTIEIIEGRFAAAMQTLLPVGPDAVELARSAPLLEIGLDVALALDRDDVVSSYDDALANRHRGWDDIIGSRQHPFESALVRGQCPDIDATLDEITWPAAELQRQDARRWLVRASAEHGCAPCKEVMRAGRLSLENDDRSAFRFASCAEAEGELSLAADMFGRLREMRLGSLEHIYMTHPFVWIMARYHHARVLERLGRTDEARREYEDFLGHWGHADTALPALVDARAALDRLTK